MCDQIDNIVLSYDRRGISKLREYVLARSYEQAASFILEKQGRVLIATGFYVDGTAETDGPPGAVWLGRALKSLGNDVQLVTDVYCASILKSSIGDEFPVVEFPITGDDDSKQMARETLDKLSPSLLVAVERCGFTKDHVYKNMRGVDISKYTARLDYLFLNHDRTIGIGDGGNEIGMGSIYSHLLQVPCLTLDPAITPVTHLLIASVSNWGAYGLVAALSKSTGKCLLPSVEEEWSLLTEMVDKGSIDSFSRRFCYQVDGFSFEKNASVLRSLYESLT